MENDDLWKKIGSTFLKTVEVKPSEAFVTRVMARIHEAEMAQAPRPWTSWLIPSFGAGFAGLLLAITVASSQNELSAESLLETDGGSWVTATNDLENDTVLGYAMEGAQ